VVGIQIYADFTGRSRDQKCRDVCWFLRLTGDESPEDRIGRQKFPFRDASGSDEQHGGACIPPNFRRPLAKIFGDNTSQLLSGVAEDKDSPPAFSQLKRAVGE
jgi:hypothetical protein